MSHALKQIHDQMLAGKPALLEGFEEMLLPGAPKPPAFHVYIGHDTPESHQSLDLAAERIRG